MEWILGRESTMVEACVDDHVRRSDIGGRNRIPTCPSTQYWFICCGSFQVGSSLSSTGLAVLNCPRVYFIINHHSLITLSHVREMRKVCGPLGPTSRHTMTLLPDYDAPTWRNLIWGMRIWLQARRMDVSPSPGI